MSHKLNLISIFLSGFLMLLSCAKTCKAQSDTTGYFSMAKPNDYPPYDSNQWRNGRKTLMWGHVGHSVSMGLVYGGLLDLALQTRSTGLILGTTLANSLPSYLKFKNNKIQPNAFWLNHHGEMMGLWYGRAFSQILYGKSSTTQNASQMALITSLSSFGLGEFGYWLGKQKNITDNEASHYKYYGTMGAALGFFWGAWRYPDFKRIASGSLIGAGTGYLVGHKLTDWNNYTRGDFIATSAFTAFQLNYGIQGIIAYNQENGKFNENYRDYIVVPLIAMLGGTILNQHWTNNARLSRNQGKELGGILLGGFVFDLILKGIIQEKHASFKTFVPSYAASMALYRIKLEQMKDNNLNARYNHGSNIQSSLSILPPTPISKRQYESNDEGLYNQKFMTPQINFRIKF